MAGDQRAEEMVHDLITCLCAQLAEAGRAVCCCQWLTHERRLLPDGCDCECSGGQGVAWVRIVERRYSPTEAPRSRGFDGRPCGPTMWGEEWLMEAGVTRCWPTRKEGLGCDEASELSADLAWDQDLLMQALVCCEPLARYGIVPSASRVLGPQGGCVAGLVEFTARPAPRYPYSSVK